MKKYTVLLLTVFLLNIIIACNLNSPSSDNDTENTTEQGNTESNISNEEGKTLVKLINNSQFKVKVFNDSLRAEEICTLEQGESYCVDEVESASGTVYYLTYFIDVGIEVPWYDTNSVCYALPKANETVSSSIPTPQSMTTRNCYVVIENKSSETIIFKQGSSELLFLTPNITGVAEIKSVYFGNFPSFDITRANNTSIGLPSQITQFEAGYIYTISVENTAILKSIAPFNLDTKKQMWNFSDNSTFDNTFPITLRERKNISDGCLIMGTLANDNTSIGLKKLDKYNSKNTLSTAKLTHDTNVTVKQSKVLDFVEQSDGSIVLLLQNTFASSNGLEERTFIVCYDFSSKQIKWSHIFSDTSKMMFRADSKNKLLCTTDGTIALAGSVITDDKMKRYFAVLDATGQLKSWTSSDFTDISSGIETMFTSAWYDGTDYYVCGYENCDFQYSSRTHKGIIYKFSSDLESVEKIYEQDNTLFLCIDGIKGSEEKWYVCGEYLDSGKILKGCYLSSSLVKANSEPIKYATYSANKPYCYFTQICCYKNKIIVGGEASDDFAGNNAIPLIVAFDCDSDKTMFENTSFSQYNKLGSIIPNEINTYIVQLLSSSDVHYVSADLLGNE